MPPPSQTFCASGCFTTPSGIQHVCIQAYGGGGGGGGGGSCLCAGGAGGGGGFGKGIVPVTPGTKYAVTVGGGGGGSAGSGQGNAGPGGSSSFTGNCAKQVGGHGGCGGHGGLPNNSQVGAGGTGFGNAATTTNSGGNGTGAHGGNGAAPLCAPGGNNGPAGGVGQAPGGAGGSGSGFCAGGNGAHGRVIITWNCPMSAPATACPISGPAPLSVNFSVSPSGGSGGYTYSWNFGDGGTSTLKSPTHKYPTAGSFSPTLIVKDSICDSLNPSVPKITVNVPKTSCCKPGNGKTGTQGSPKSGSPSGATSNKVSQANGIDSPQVGRGVIPRVGLIG